MLWWLDFHTLFAGACTKTKSFAGLSVREVMDRTQNTFSSKTNLREVLASLNALGRGKVVPVVENGYLMGVVTPEALRKLKPGGITKLENKLEAIMIRRSNLLGLSPEVAVDQAIEQMMAKTKPFAAVIEQNGQFAGIFYLSDLPRQFE